MFIELIVGGTAFIIVFVPTMFFFFQCILGLTSPKQGPSYKDRAGCVVLIPAHNEEQIIQQTLMRLLEEIGPDDRIVVVADNCTDNTAKISRALDVDVIERQSQMHKGKPYALEFGLQYIAKQPLQTIVIFDADCEFKSGSLNHLVSSSQQLNCVVQSLYLMQAPKQAPLKIRFAEFTWLIKNRIRPLGQRKLGMGSQLHGSGMAFPWETISTMSLATNSIVEDLELGLSLAAQDKFAYFEDRSVVVSTFPCSEQSLSTQRTRWEAGHLHSIKSNLPRLFSLLFQRKYKSTCMFLDALIPPTLMLVLLLLSSLCLSLLLLIVDIYTPFFLVSLAFLSVVIAITLCWLKHGRDLVSAAELGKVCKLLFSKAKSYKTFMKNKELKWVKTNRN